ncbi:MAG: hypothetical protein IJA83_08565 [Clostridia bacterium]|nr:hypothetical protein [Clostridia bacterium]
MAENKRKSRGFAIFIAVLVVLLIGAIALFVYGSMNNGVVAPRLRPNLNGLGMLLRHG